MGLAIGYSVGLSLPLVGANLMLLIFGGPFPGDPSFWSRMYIAHVLLIPVAIGLLLGAHLTLVALRHHTQFKERRRQSERKLVGVPAFPGQAPRSLGLMIGVFGVLFLLGGLVQINPIWLWGPYHVGLSTNGAQPDWYLGWLIGALRLVPGWDFTIGSYTVVPNPFWGGAAFPLIVFGLLYAWPALERRVTGDRAWHNVLERPRDNPWRTGIGVAVVLWVLLVFVAGAVDRTYVFFGITYQSQIWAFRVAIWVVPLLALFVTKRVCEELLAGEQVAKTRRAAEREAEREAERAVAI
jgi:ubiquinol-cytochrome c reductase cytochrome b subunit